MINIFNLKNNLIKETPLIRLNTYRVHPHQAKSVFLLENFRFSVNVISNA